MIFYLKEKNKKIVKLNVDVTLDYFKIVDYEILTNTLPNIFKNLNENNNEFGLMILNNFVNNRIYLPERFITDYIKTRKSIVLDNKAYKYDYNESPHFMNIINNFKSFTDEFTIVPYPESLNHEYDIFDVYNLQTPYITVKRDDGIYQEIFKDQDQKKKAIPQIKEFYDKQYSDFLKFDDSACCRIGFKFNKNIKFISLSDLLIDYIPQSSNLLLEIKNQYIHIEDKILRFYGEKALQAFYEKRFLDFVQKIDFDLCFLLNKNDEFIYFSFF